MPSDLSSTIQQTAAEPASATRDGQSVQAQPIDKLIEADRYLAAKQAAKNRRSGVRFAKLIPPGMT